MITNPLQRQEADVNASLSDLKLNDSQVLVNFIQVTKEAELCPVKIAQRSMAIPKGEAMKIPRRINTGPVERTIPVHAFEPEATAP